MQTIVIKIVAIIFAVMSIAAFITFGIDKRKSIKKTWRIPEKTLLLLAALGGSFGAALGMSVFRHKTQHKNFTVTVPLFMAVHIALLVFIALKTQL